MEKDFKWITLHINAYHLNNFALGFDFYKLYEHPTGKYEASILQLSFLFFNVTITKWADPYVG